jgi:hypothetical protein
MEETAITTTETNAAETPAGVPDGTVLETTDHEGNAVQERVVIAEDGTWHKEPIQ